jgi:hypothetical protein
MATAFQMLDARRVQRDIVSFRAALDGPGGVRTTVLVVDISPLGFMSRTRAPLQPGDVIAIKLPIVGARAARVVWSMAGRVGGEFAEIIPAAAYGRMLASAPNDPPTHAEF